MIQSAMPYSTTGCSNSQFPAIKQVPATVPVLSSLIHQLKQSVIHNLIVSQTLNHPLLSPGQKLEKYNQQTVSPLLLYCQLQPLQYRNPQYLVRTKVC